jgi:glycosyltransferase involved in cell wall biosynthesis
MIRVSHFSALERSGGAARAALRLHRALLESGLRSTMVVHRRETDDPSVIALDRRLGSLSFHVPFRIDDLISRRVGPRDGVTRSAALVGRSFARALELAPCDIAHLHWINYGFLRPESLPETGRPLVWTLHDQWAFCGGEHYPQSNRFETGYRSEEAPAKGFDLDRWIFRRKRRAYSRIPSLTLVAPSRWMMECATRSVLLGARPVEVIPYAVDITTFKPLGRAFSRAALNLPADRPLLLTTAICVTSDPRKGWAQLEHAIGRLAADRVDFELVVVGALKGPTLPVRTHYLGWLHDDVTLATACCAADLFVCPSVQDNLPNTVIEALACGTPCVAFAIGGLPDLITHEQDGYLARPLDSADLAAGLRWVLSDGQRRTRLGEAARAGAERRFAPPVIAARHRQLYEKILADSRQLRGSRCST